jgi:diguanylate cyclase (GGDEF)-like protein
MKDRGPGTAASARPALIRTAALALGIAGLVILAGGGDGFWLCIPGGVFLSARCTSRVAAAASTATVTIAAAAPSLASTQWGPQPPIALALLIPLLSTAVVVRHRERAHREREELRASALSDPLTGVANRRSLLTRIEYEIARHRRSRRSFALVMLDLDGFKLLNDRFGHPAGDELLREVAAELQRAMRAQDTVARIGGDEFCVLGPETSREGAQRLAVRAHAAVSRVTAGVQALGTSSGTALFPQDATTVAGLLEAADERLLLSKRGRRETAQQRRAA